MENNTRKSNKLNIKWPFGYAQYTFTSILPLTNPTWLSVMLEKITKLGSCPSEPATADDMGVLTELLQLK